jgi:hypothetical protein
MTIESRFVPPLSGSAPNCEWQRCAVHSCAVDRNDIRSSINNLYFLSGDNIFTKLRTWQFLGDHSSQNQVLLVVHDHFALSIPTVSSMGSPLISWSSPPSTRTRFPVAHIFFEIDAEKEQSCQLLQFGLKKIVMKISIELLM